jgi:hypothetical protein
MDPLGFALENFDAIGKWRTVDAETPVDASGTLPDGTKFEGLDGLRGLLLRDREQFVSNVIGKLLGYGLGRGVKHYDLPAIRSVLRSSAANDYRWSSIILGVVQSIPFQMRQSAASSAAQ